ncbi:MAG: Sialic acid utilization regulator, RpiR family [Massilibacillus sp.]|nr:Sialic acid utilization regulator, RpiR family [Massilibacillus sp.]
MQEQEMQVINQIFATYNDLYDAEKKVADYVVENQETVIEMTVSELASESQTSEATIIRFCKKCGCKGFHHMKIKMAKEMLDKGNQTISSELNIHKMRQSLNNILANKIQELHQTISHINEVDFKEILDAIIRAKTVLFAAMGNTIPIAIDGSYKFNQIGIAAVSSTIWETQLAFSHTLQEGDVVIAISASGASKYLVELAKVASEKGAKVIAITNNSNSPLSKESHYHITTATRESLFIEKVSFTRLSALAVLEAIFLLLVTSKNDACTYISEHEQMVADDKI